MLYQVKFYALTPRSILLRSKHNLSNIQISAKPIFGIVITSYLDMWVVSKSSWMSLSPANDARRQVSVLIPKPQSS